ncbi:hypothetical protein [Actinoplanes sp. HUAS TT8]|uniref:hypothetical protein n=1 Tax=Actinoplanes sp. HUAS TT8 TaxID=3447453 RepID=UPI003F521E7C
MRIRLPGTVVVVIAVALAPATPAAATLTGKWTADPVTLKPAAATGAGLHDVSARSATDVWAVGSWWDASTHPISAHFDGLTWSPVPVPATTPVDLFGVDGAAADDVWAVGGDGGPAPVTMHFDGRAWTAVSAPGLQVTGTVATLNDVDMVSTGDGWAVGTVTAGAKPPQALLAHWGGGKWTRFPAPSDAQSMDLEAVNATSGTDVWAVGSQLRTDGSEAALALHFDGSRWLSVPLPEAGADGEKVTLESVSAAGRDEVWAVGEACRTGGGIEICRPVTLRLSGGAWKVMPTTGGGTEFTGVVAFSPSDVWIIGYAAQTAVADTDYAEHWDGTTFTAEATVPPSSPVPMGELASALEAVTGDRATGQLWAAGWTADPGGTKPSPSPVFGTTHLVHRG